MLKVVENTRENFVDLMKDMISIKSLTCKEGDFAKFLLDRLGKVEGVDEVFADGAGNVCAIIRGDGTGPNILLNGHMDAVAEGNLENWLPFEPYKMCIRDRDLHCIK